MVSHYVALSRFAPHRAASRGNAIATLKNPVAICQAGTVNIRSRAAVKPLHS
jgi:hypothetical protein